MGENNNNISAGGRGPSPSALSAQNIKNAQISAQKQAQAKISASQNINYWLGDIGEVSKLIKVCTLNFQSVINSIQTMYRELFKIVNATNGWNDDNSEIFARWWNTGEFKSLGFEAGKLSISNTSEAGSLRYVINKCAKLYWMVVCNQLYFVTNGKYNIKKELFKTSLIDLNALYELGKDTSYLEKPTLTTQDSFWGDMMAKIPGMKYFNWDRYVQLNSTKKESSSKTAIEDLCKKFAEESAKVRESVQTYVSSLEKITKDKVNKVYFGLEPNVGLDAAIEDIEKYIYSTINSFGIYVGVILRENGKSVGDDIQQYFNVKI